MSVIARTLGRNKSTLSRELARNQRSGRNNSQRGSYDASVADTKYRNRRRQAKYGGMLVYSNDDLRTYVVTALKRGFSPEAIAGRIRAENRAYSVSKNSVYTFLYSPYGQRWCRYLKSRRYHRRRKKAPKPKRRIIPNRISIHERPDTHGEYGHFEADTIVSGKKTGSTAAISTMYELKSMHIDARKISSVSPRYHTKAQRAMLSKWKQPRSVTQDNGIENAHHERLNINTYFCDPHAPWQKPGIENANRLIRRFIPKGSDISLYSPAFVRWMVRKLNDTPRKALMWKTPNEVVCEQKLLKI